MNKINNVGHEFPQINPEKTGKDRPAVEKTEKVIFNPLIKFQTCEKADIMRITQREDLTVIDFACYANARYVNGGWARVQPGCFIRPIGTSDKLGILKAINIPFEPNLHYFKGETDALFFTLVFPGLPKNTTHIDIVDKEGCDGRYFDWHKKEEWGYMNIYGVALTKVHREAIKIWN
jgi:hypothetical protein